MPLRLKNGNSPAVPGATDGDSGASGGCETSTRNRGVVSTFAEAELVLRSPRRDRPGERRGSFLYSGCAVPDQPAAVCSFSGSRVSARASAVGQTHSPITLIASMITAKPETDGGGNLTAKHASNNRSVLRRSESV